MNLDQEIEEALASGDPEEINRVLAKIEGGETAEATETDEAETEGETADTPEAEAGESSTQGAQPKAKDQEDEPETDEKPVVMTKDGKHTIPYEELERARNDGRMTKQELAQAKSLIDDLTAKQADLTARLNWTEKQLKKAGIDPTDPPEALNLTDEKLEELEENYGEVGTVIRAIHAQNQRLMRQLQSKQSTAEDSDSNADTVPTQSDVNQAIERNTDLKTWITGDQPKFKIAVEIDNALRADPKWMGKTLDERFTEVVRRTKAVFGDTYDPPAPDQQRKADAKAPAQKAPPKQKPSTPDSLSDITAMGVEGERSAAESLADLSPAQLQAKMARMTPAQIDALLESL